MRDLTPVTGNISKLSDDWTEDAPRIEEKIKKFPLTKEECLKIGGHCWVDDPWIYATTAPIHSQHCKHCGKRQEGRQQDPIDWHDV